MKNNTKKAPVKFQDDLLYFQHFMLIFVFVPNCDYHHLNSKVSLYTWYDNTGIMKTHVVCIFDWQKNISWLKVCSKQISAFSPVTKYSEQSF